MLLLQMNQVKHLLLALVALGTLNLIGSNWAFGKEV